MTNYLNAVRLGTDFWPSYPKQVPFADGAEPAGYSQAGFDSARQIPRCSRAEPSCPPTRMGRKYLRTFSRTADSAVGLRIGSLEYSIENVIDMTELAL